MSIINPSTMDHSNGNLRTWLIQPRTTKKRQSKKQERANGLNESIWRKFWMGSKLPYPRHIRRISAMEMGFKCGRTEFEYKAALGLRQNQSSLYYYLDHDGSGNWLDAPEWMINAPVRRDLYLETDFSLRPTQINLPIFNQNAQVAVSRRARCWQAHRYNNRGRSALQAHQQGDLTPWQG